MTWAWERGEKLVMLPDQHLGRNTAFKMGVPLDEMVVWDPNEIWGGLDAGAGEEGEADSVEGPLLGPHPLHRPADRGVPQEVPGGQGHRASGVHVRRRAGRRRERLDRAHHQHREGQPAGHRLGGRDRGPPGQPPDRTKSRRTRPSSRSIRSAACARRCSASRRTTCSGCSKGWSRARSTTRSPSPSRRRVGRQARARSDALSASYERRLRS